MKIFVDTGSLEEIKKANDLGVLDGVTTNPSLIAKEKGVDFHTRIADICKVVKGPVSAEVVSTDTPGMLKEAEELIKIAPNVTIKLPTIAEGLKACKILSERGVKVNMTLVFQPLQALMVAKAGATFASPFLGRLDDIGQDGMTLIREIRTIYNNYGYKTQILAASIRSPLHLVQAAMIGADVATVPYKVLEEVLHHPLTDSGLKKFLEDWEKSHASKA